MKSRANRAKTREVMNEFAATPVDLIGAVGHLGSPSRVDPVSRYRKFPNYFLHRLPWPEQLRHGL
jgi:hypothetical protein